MASISNVEISILTRRYMRSISSAHLSCPVMPTNTASRAIIAICAAIVEAVKEVPEGAPSSSLYLALHEQGCSLAQYEQIMGALVETGRLRKEGHLYFDA